MKLDQYMSSPDIEMIRLGCKIIEAEYPKEEWSDILDNYCKVLYISKNSDVQKTLLVGYEIFVIKIDDTLEVNRLVSAHSIWEQTQKTDAPLLKMSELSTNKITLDAEAFKWSVPHQSTDVNESGHRDEETGSTTTDYGSGQTTVDEDPKYLV